jgi:phosphoserine phosphatase
MDPETFAAVIPEAAGATLDGTDVTVLSEDYGSVVIADLAADIESEFAYLYDTYEGLGCASDCKTLDEIKETPEYQDLIAKLPFLYDGLTETDGVGANYSYPWVTFFYAGYTLDEVKPLAREAFDEQSAVTIEKIKLTSPESLPGEAGVLSFSYKAGVRATPEISGLMAMMREAGFDVWVITASFEGTVQSVSEPDAYGYEVPNDHVIGNRLKQDADGKYLPEVDDSEGYAITYRQGKADVLRNLVGKAPIFAAGDSDTDFEMMTSFAETKMSLVVNRLKGGDIGSLYTLLCRGRRCPGVTCCRDATRTKALAAGT